MGLVKKDGAKAVVKTLRREVQLSELFTTSAGGIDITESAWMLIGPPKIGKSTLASGWPGVRFLVTSRKEVGSLKVPYALIDTWKKTVDVLEHLIANRNTIYKDTKTVVVDYIDQVHVNCGTFICKKLGVDHESEAGYGKGVNMIDSEFRRWMNKLIASDYAVVIISHLQEKEVIKDGKSFRKQVSTLPDRPRKIVIPLVSVIGVIQFDTQAIKEKDKIRHVNRRVISFEATEYIEAGDRDGYLPNEVTLLRNQVDNFKLFESFYTGEKKKETYNGNI